MENCRKSGSARRIAAAAGVSLRMLERLLRETTERLAAELAVPQPLAPEWTEAHWLTAQAVASIHGIAPLLATKLGWKGPRAWVDFLTVETSLARRRAATINKLLGSIDSELARAGIPAVALKGAALYRQSLYQPGERPMADVDLLVRTWERERAARVIETIGFEETSRHWKNTVYSARGQQGPWHPQQPGDHPIKIELHDRIGEMLPRRIVELTSSMFPEAATAGLNAYPSRAALIAHLLQHAAGAMVERELRLVQLHDIALLAEGTSAEEWAAVLGMGPENASAWWIYPPLALTARYYPQRIPQSILDDAGNATSAWLRHCSSLWTLTDVSLSHPWIQALPGIAWARSPAQIVEYVGRRVIRDRDERRMRRLAAETEPELTAAERRWLHVPQALRMLQYLCSRPTRSLTMRMVRGAFDASQLVIRR